MGTGYEFGSADIWHPDLDRAKPLTAQPFSVLSYSSAGRDHTPMLHVTDAGCFERQLAGLSRPLVLTWPTGLLS